MEQRLQNTLHLFNHIDWRAVAIVTAVITIITAATDPAIMWGAAAITFGGATASCAHLALEQHGETSRLGDDMSTFLHYYFLILLMGAFFLGFGALIASPFILVFEELLTHQLMMALMGLGTLVLLPLWFAGKVPEDWQED